MPGIIIPINIKFWTVESLDATGDDVDVPEFDELCRGYTVVGSGSEPVASCLRLNNRLNMLLMLISFSSIIT
jgi:hypothetical protein